MGIVMKGHSWSPMYWRNVFLGLVDLVKQIGYPSLFFTIAPYEWSFPYHAWVRDEMAKTLRGRLNLPFAESVHIAHVFLELVRGLLTGRRYEEQGRKHRQWGDKCIFHCKDGSGRRVVINYFTRLEFQDGRRKKGTQKYHGSGRVHAHVLLWMRNLDVAEIHEDISCTLPSEEPMRNYVKGSQLDCDRQSKWPVHEGPSIWDADRSTLHLHHTEEDHNQGLRAYLPAIMDVLKCHQDVQIADPDKFYIQYCTKYLAKFSCSQYDEWLNGGHADSIARRMCNEYHPLEPEMVLQLCGRFCKQWDLGTVSGGMRSIVAPWPGMPEKPHFIELPDP